MVSLPMHSTQGMESIHSRGRAEADPKLAGTTAHIVYMGLCLINNIIAVANMLLGASAAITALYGHLCRLLCAKSLNDK